MATTPGHGHRRSYDEGRPTCQRRTRRCAPSLGAAVAWLGTDEVGRRACIAHQQSLDEKPVFFLESIRGVLPFPRSRKGEDLLMPSPTNQNDLALSVCLRRELRLQLEQLRLARGYRQHKLPSLRALIEEAVQALVERETTTSLTR